VRFRFLGGVAAFLLILAGGVLSLFSVAVAFGWDRGPFSVAGTIIAISGFSLMFGGYWVVRRMDGGGEPGAELPHPLSAAADKGWATLGSKAVPPAVDGYGWILHSGQLQVGIPTHYWEVGEYVNCNASEVDENSPVVVDCDPGIADTQFREMDVKLWAKVAPSKDGIMVKCQCTEDSITCHLRTN
jgi:hypothetical protein